MLLTLQVAAADTLQLGAAFLHLYSTFCTTALPESMVIMSLYFYSKFKVLTAIQHATLQPLALALPWAVADAECSAGQVQPQSKCTKWYRRTRSGCPHSQWCHSLFVPAARTSVTSL